MTTEADTCRKYVLPKLYAAGWADDQISQERYFTDGRIVPVGKGHVRKPGKRADYLLSYRPDMPIAVVEAKADYKTPGAGMQQAMDYAQILGLKFAYATNGHGIEEYDFTTGKQTSLDGFPSPEELWRRLRDDQKLTSDADAEDLLFPFNRELRNADGSVKRPRYYQEIAINRAVQAVIQDITHKHPDYVARVVSEEGKVGRQYLDRFQDPEQEFPVIVTTSKLLSTGVDVPTCCNIVLFKPINSIVEFKQIIGRGTRLFVDGNKLWFTILDYVGATRLFYDPDFDGIPELTAEETINQDGQVTSSTEAGEVIEVAEGPEEEALVRPIPGQEGEPEPRKYYVDGVQVQIIHELVQELDPKGQQLRVRRFDDYTREQVRTLYDDAGKMRSAWCDPERRAEIISQLEKRGISFEGLAEAMNQPDADPFDLLIHVAFNAPLRSRRERAEAVRREHKAFFKAYGDQARVVLDYLLDKYTDHGVAQLTDLHILEMPDIPVKGTVIEIADLFGGVDELKEATLQLQNLIYAA
jgi:type I site-specific restriction endonuclease